ncbi:MAG: hypothetical protein ABIJ42_03025 [Acidobacteriota bacterium]
MNTQESLHSGMPYPETSTWKGKIIRYDAAWRELDKFQVDEKKVTVEPGDHTFEFDCNFGKGADPKVKIEIRTLAGPERVQALQEIKIE